MQVMMKEKVLRVGFIHKKHRSHVTISAAQTLRGSGPPSFALKQLPPGPAHLQSRHFSFSFLRKAGDQWWCL